VTTAFVLHDHGITNVDSAAKAAMALRPLAGSLESLLFTLGIFGVGLLAVPVMAGASAYAVAEVFRWNEGLSKRFNAARGFYLVIIASMFAGMLLNFIGVNPIKALYYAAVLNGVIAPILMFFIFRIGADESIMGRFTSPRWVSICGWTATVLMGVWESCAWATALLPGRSLQDEFRRSAAGYPRDEQAGPRQSEAVALPGATALFVGRRQNGLGLHRTVGPLPTEDPPTCVLAGEGASSCWWAIVDGLGT
jgi:hypothetical protein